MKIYDEDKFKKYLNKPVRVKMMGISAIAIAEGAILASFSTRDELRKYFPYGDYVLIQ